MSATRPIGCSRSELTFCRGGRTEEKGKAEVRPGQEIVVRSGLLEIGGASAKFRHRVFLGEKMAFQTVFTCALFDLKARKAALIDDALRREMENYLIDET